MLFSPFDEVEVLQHGSDDKTGAVIFLHGAGGSGAKSKDHMEELFESIGASFPTHVKIYFPTAPERLVTIRDKVMTSWFDGERNGIALQDINLNYDDVEEAANYVIGLIKEIEATGIPRNRIALAGLSQGGMLAQYVVFTKMKDVAGILIMASVFPFAKAKMLKPPFPELMQLYGLKDPIIPLKAIRMGEVFLRSHGISPILRTLPKSTHELDEHYLKHFVQWIEKILPPL